MDTSSAELREVRGDPVAVSFDGTWIRRGYSSLHGVFVCIFFWTGRVLDIHLSSI